MTPIDDKTSKTITTALCLLCLVACNSDDEDSWQSLINSSSSSSSTTNTTIDDTSTDDGTAQEATTDLLDFSVSWDTVSEDTFTDATETIVTDENDERYEDYVENASFSTTITITYSGTTATITGSADGVTIEQSGAHITVTSTVAGIAYELTGSATNGSFKIYSDYKFQLSLNGVSLTSTQSSAINIQSSKRCFLVLSDDTESTLTDASSYSTSDEDEKACLFSEGQVIVSGTGSLTINGNYKHGICSDEYLFIRPGCTITVASAVKDAIHTNEAFIMTGGTLLLTPSSDGIQCEEDYIEISGGLIKAQITGTASKAIKAETDITISGGTFVLLTSGGAEYDSDDKDVSACACIKAGGDITITDCTAYMKSTGKGGKGISSDGTLTISGGVFRILTTGAKYTYSSSLTASAKGMKADGNVIISGDTVIVKTTGGDGSEGIESKAILKIEGGIVAVYSYDDALNASNNITITGGGVYAYGVNNDGIDSNGTLTISGGTIVASGTSSPEEAIDTDGNTFKITGGTIIGMGGTGTGDTSPTSSACTQNSLIYKASASSGTLYTIIAADSTHIMSYTAPRTYSSMAMIFSSAKLEQGTTYSIYTGGSITGGTEFFGLILDAEYTLGSKATSFTPSSVVTTVSGSSSSTGGSTTGPGGSSQPGGSSGGRM